MKGLATLSVPDGPGINVQCLSDQLLLWNKLLSYLPAIKPGIKTSRGIFFVSIIKPG